MRAETKMRLVGQDEAPAWDKDDVPRCTALCTKHKIGGGGAQTCAATRPPAPVDAGTSACEPVVRRMAAEVDGAR